MSKGARGAQRVDRDAKSQANGQPKRARGARVIRRSEGSGCDADREGEVHREGEGQERSFLNWCKGEILQEFLLEYHRASAL